MPRARSTSIGIALITAAVAVLSACSSTPADETSISTGTGTPSGTPQPVPSAAPSSPTVDVPSAGDCLRLAEPDEETVTEYHAAVPCDEAHHSEILEIAEVPEGFEQSTDQAEDMDELAEVCPTEEAAAEFLGDDYPWPRRVFATTLLPSKLRRAQGETWVACVLIPNGPSIPKGEPDDHLPEVRTASLRGAMAASADPLFEFGMCRKDVSATEKGFMPLKCQRNEPMEWLYVSPSTMATSAAAKDAPFPGKMAAERRAMAACAEIARKHSDSTDPEIWVYWQSEESWKAGDRGQDCYLRVRDYTRRRN